MTRTKRKPLSSDLLRNIDGYRRATTYLLVGQICRRSVTGDGAGRSEYGVELSKGRGIKMEMFQSMEGF